VNWVLSIIFETRGRKLYDGECLVLHSSPSIIREFNSRRIRWAGNVA
jgi:hypothetical protein